MIAIAPFRAADLAAMRVQPAQASLARHGAHVARAAEAAGRCFTVRAPDGAVLMCGGAAEVHADYASLWAVLAEDAGPWMTAISRRTRQFIAALPHRRIDASARIDFPAAHRWLALLGFGPAPEAILRNYLPGGGDAAIYRWGGI